MTTNSSLMLRGSTALVTGASSGIGRAIATNLARAGVHVGLLARRSELLAQVAAEIEAAGGCAIPVVADVSQEDETRLAVSRFVAVARRLDIVVNAAGTAGQRHLPFDEVGPGSWQTMVGTNLVGLMNTTHAALPHLLVSAGGRRGVADLINISSTAGRRILPGTAVYSATKFGVGAFCEGLRKELAGRSVRVSLVEPGWVNTPLTDGVDVDRSYPWLQPCDVAEAVQYIASRDRHVAVNELLLRPTGQVN